jgi:hypothetical protein
MTPFCKQVMAGGALILERTYFTDLLTNDGKVVGAVGFNLDTTEFVVVRAKEVVLAMNEFNPSCRDMFYCPDQPAKIDIYSDFGYSVNSWLVKYEHYYRKPCASGSWDAWILNVTKDADVKQPSKAMNVMEVHGTNNRADATTASYWAFRHDSKQNVAFYGGNVESRTKYRMTFNEGKGDQYFGLLRYGFDFGCKSYCSKLY